MIKKIHSLFVRRPMAKLVAAPNSVLAYMVRINRELHSLGLK